MLSVYNDLTRKKETFIPLTPGRVNMYVCGMTVYDYCHLGHARAQLVFDVVARYLRWRGYRVTYVRNITDIDDKIIKRANERGEKPGELSERFIAAFQSSTPLPPGFAPSAAAIAATCSGRRARSRSAQTTARDPRPEKYPWNTCPWKVCTRAGTR